MSDISTLDENSKVVFFNNLFNIMTGRSHLFTLLTLKLFILPIYLLIL